VLGWPIDHTDEMRPAWFSESEIPYDSMWEDDRYWLPQLLAGKKIQAEFTLDGDNKVVQQALREYGALPSVAVDRTTVHP